MVGAFYSTTTTKKYIYGCLRDNKKTTVQTNHNKKYSIKKSVVRSTTILLLPYVLSIKKAT